MFYGIIVRMYFAPGEHNPPHFHVYYNEYKASVDIRRAKSLTAIYPEGNRSWSWHGQNFTRKSWWQIGTSS